MPDYNHDYTDGQIVYDIKYDEFFIFRNNRDGQLAEMQPQRLRLANALEIYKYNEYIQAFNAGQEMAVKSDKISNE